MNYEIPKCPECNKIAIGEMDMIPAIANVFLDDDGSFQYTGDTNIDWDSQKNIMRIVDRIIYNADLGYKIVTCGDHDWVTKVED